MAAQRRKIFPHLDESEKKKNDSHSHDDKPSADDKHYDNAKTEETKRLHPSARKKSPSDAAPANGDAAAAGTTREAARHHLLPLPLVVTVLLCSGFFWISSFRDMMATGKPILDTLGVVWGQSDGDANLLQYTKSTAWFDDSRGWKSKQGGLSAILPVTTDANNMGGLFVRKLSGGAGMAYHTAKLWPVVFQSFPYYSNAKQQQQQRGVVMVGPSWSAGHFDPLLVLGILGDVAVSTFYLLRLEDLKSAGSRGLGMAYVLAGLVEALVFGSYVITRRMSGAATNTKQSGAGKAASDTDKFDPLDYPNTLPSRIVARTVLIVSTLISIISLRDLFFPGTILSFIPRDDIYLEWTGAFLHSPPPDTVESDEHGLEAPLYAGDKFVSQLLGLYLSLGCMLKFASVFGWTKGSKSMGGNVDNEHRWGIVSSKLIWKTQALGDMLLLTLLRMFTPAAQSASLDLRWHLMFVAYEMFILFLHAFW